MHRNRLLPNRAAAPSQPFAAAARVLSMAGLVTCLVGAAAGPSGAQSVRLPADAADSAALARVMPELASSLPVAGLDGTMRRSRSPVGRAHLKTGSLRDVAGIAGYVLGDSGRRSVVVAVINHPNANAARPALDAIVEWAAADAGGRR